MEQTQAVKSSEINSQQVSWTQRFGDWLNAPFPFYLNDDRKNFLLVTVLSAFVTLFLYLFKTESEFSFANGLEWLHGLITFGALLVNLLVLPRIFPALMDPTAWTIKKYIVFNVWHLVLIWAIATVFEKMFFCPFDMGWITVMRHTIVQVAIKGIIPIALCTLFLKAQLLQQSLREAIKTNQELQKIQVLKREAKEAIKTASQITLYSDTSESLSFNLPDLLFIEADDNYSTVMWKENGTLQKKLLRVNLKNLESQLDNSFTLRCHRSYIVNVNAISAISGNTNGYKLKINGSDFSIPVSRPKGKEIMEKISQLRNMMELS
ncbi:MAG: LytTR family transcriptional regulator [Cytophagales bacterium]|nr:LytTR family transcriptional regulator [Cytophagales bacterium]MCA6368096.1 LytTR family transcriptional regulator [Cytophagales bacterium]MCA6370610.1 LytTR family transcriptional regulator [Cytophagales bacterium]MCA6375703.1 LytTR family transcriptional regulator [Cytophagales bacterium]MCA6384096.1 LytTR family transcriptional regulator [Cytophagales bacterium]